MACAIPTPSVEDVPRPSSSTSTNDFAVARPVHGVAGVDPHASGRTEYHGTGHHFVCKGAEALLGVVIIRQTREKGIVDPAKLEYQIHTL